MLQKQQKSWLKSNIKHNSDAFKTWHCKNDQIKIEWNGLDLLRKVHYP